MSLSRSRNLWKALQRFAENTPPCFLLEVLSHGFFNGGLGSCDNDIQTFNVGAEIKEFLGGGFLAVSAKALADLDEVAVLIQAVTENTVSAFLLGS